jgi:hypothetical protein
MNAVVMQMFNPDIDAMRSHVEHLFGGFLYGCHDGLIELAWTDTQPDASGRYRLRHARMFGTDQLDELVEEAARLNATPMCNVYIGAALRRPDTPPFGRADDKDVLALPAAYTDQDEQGSATGAKSVYGATKPTMVVVTGSEPFTRAQLWWRLEQPCTDPALWPDMLRGMALAMGGDTTVTNPSRVMRLAGSIAWPVKDGRRTELTRIVPLKEPGQPSYMLEHLTALFPPQAAMPGGQVVAVDVQRTTNGLGLQDKIADGRERYMRDTVLACLIEFVGENGAAPSAQELFDAAWPQYERHVDLSRAGRGPEEFAEKCRYTVQRFERGELRGLETLERACEVAQRKRAAADGARSATRQVGGAPAENAGPASEQEDDAGPIFVGDLTGEPKPREWFVTDWVPAGSVTALYGDGGTGKTLLAQQLLYAAGVGGQWCGIDVPKARGLGVFCEDDADELHRRHNDIKKAMGIPVGNPFDQTWIWPRVGFDNLLVTFDKNNLPSMSPLFRKIAEHVMEKRIGFLILDTVADMFGGNEIIRAQVNFFIKSVCGAFIRKAKEAGWTLTVMILAHPSQSGRNSGTGESGSTGWNNAVRSRLYLTRDENGGTNDRVLTRKKSNYSAAGDEQAIELQWSEGALVVRSGGGEDGTAWPPKDVCQQVLDAIREAWATGRPWSNSPRARNEGRYAPRIISMKFPVRPQVAERMVEQWLINGVLAVEVRDKNTKMAGLKVIGSIW